MAGLAEQLVGNAGETVGGIQLGQHAGGAVRMPGDGAIRLFHQRVGLARHALGFEIWLFFPADRSIHRPHRRLGHFIAIDRRLARRAHRESRQCPDRAGVHLRFGLQHRHAPFADAVLDRPVERRRTAVADDARMHDQAKVARPDRFGYRPLQERRQDQVGLEQRHRLLGHRIGDVEFDADFVPALGQFAIKPLRQAVETVSDEKNSHVLHFFTNHAGKLIADGRRLCGACISSPHNSITLAIFLMLQSLPTMHCNKK